MFVTGTKPRRCSVAEALQLLMPEIRATISNLSQAIRFVVQNDFFDGVELKPGDAKPALVQMIPDKESDAAAVVATGDTPAS